MSETTSHRGAGRHELWFSLLGGALAWLAHLLLAWAIAEFGCIAGWDERMALGLTAVAWLLIGVSGASLAVAAAATWVSYRLDRRLDVAQHSVVEERNPHFYIARAGLISNALFVFIILVQTMPVFYYLQDCGKAML